MSFELLVIVRQPVDRAGLDAALDALGAPVAAPSAPSQFAGYTVVELDFPGLELEPAGAFDAGYHPDDPEAHAMVPFAPACAYSLSPTDDRDKLLTWAVALALARAGAGVIVDLDKDKTYGPKDEQKIEAKLAAWREKLARRYAELSASEKEFRARRPDESPDAFRERVWLKRAGLDELARYIKSKLAEALGASDAATIDRLVELVPKHPMFIEPSLNPCARAGRADVAQRLATRFPATALRKHFLESVGWTGAAAVPYARFLADSGVVTLDASTLGQARKLASDADMNAWLSSL